MKFKFAIALMFCAIASTGAQAQMARLESPRGFYAGLDFDYLTATGISFTGGDLALGYRFNRFFGVESGALYTRGSGINLTSEYAEFRGYLPLLAGRLSLIGSGGVALAQTSAPSGPGCRIGAGLAYRR